MRALIAYLLTVSIFIAGGYVGFVWLTNPPSANPVAYSDSSQPHRAASSKKAPRLAGNSASTHSGDALNGAAAPAEQSGQTSLPDADNLDSSEPAGSQELTTGSTATAHDPAQIENAAASSERTQRDRVDAPQQACVPIGSTAGGDLVFPIGCREQLHRNFVSTHNRSDAAKETQQRPAVVAQRGAEAMGEPAASLKIPNLNGVTGSGAMKTASGTDENTATRIGDSTRRARPFSGATFAREPTSPTARSGRVLSQSDEWFNPLGLR